MGPEVLAEFERDRIELERRHQTIRRFRPVALAVGGVLAFLFGGIPGLVAVMLVLAVVRIVARP